MIICVSFGIFYNLDDRLKVIVKGWIFELLRVIVIWNFVSSRAFNNRSMKSCRVEGIIGLDFFHIVRYLCNRYFRVLYNGGRCLSFDFLLFLLEISRRSNYPSAVAKLREQNQHQERNEAQSLMWIIRGWLVQLKVSRRVYTLRFLSRFVQRFFFLPYLKNFHKIFTKWFIFNNILFQRIKIYRRSESLKFPFLLFYLINVCELKIYQENI